VTPDPLGLFEQVIGAHVLWDRYVLTKLDFGAPAKTFARPAKIFLRD